MKKQYEQELYMNQKHLERRKWSGNLCTFVVERHSMERLKWMEVDCELKILQLQYTKGQLLILWKSGGNPWASTLSFRAFPAAVTDGLWCLNESFGRWHEGY